MKNYNIKKDIESIRELFGLSREEYANEIGLSRMNINRYENGKVEPTISSLEKIYTFPYKKGFRLNRAKELLFIDNKNEKVLLFHGAKFELGSIKADHLVGTKDFGSGFYLGETYQSASTWICEYKESSVYAFYLNKTKDLKTISFDVSKDWLYVILYYRNALKKYEISEEIKILIQRIEESDVVIAPIADNQMYDTINRFALGEITDEQCIHALSATNLGMQYVLKSEKAIKKLELIDHLFLCEDEKKDTTKIKNDISNVGRDKAKLSFREYARKGNFIYEIFKEI